MLMPFEDNFNEFILFDIKQPAKNLIRIDFSALVRLHIFKCPPFLKA